MVVAPIVDVFLVPLVGLPLWFLRCDPSLRQPMVEVTRVKTDPKVHFNQLTNAVRCPQLANEIVIQRAGLQPRQNHSLLLAGKFRGSTADWLRLQAIEAMFFPSRIPALDRAYVHAKKVGDLLLGVTFLSASHRQLPPTFPLGGASVRFHAEAYATAFRTVQCFEKITTASNSYNRNPTFVF